MKKFKKEAHLFVVHPCQFADKQQRVKMLKNLTPNCFC
jgi:hypothetical protein